MAEKKPIGLYLHAGRQQEIIMLDRALAQDPSIKEQLGSADQDGHYHLRFPEAERETVNHLALLLDNFIYDYGFNYQEARATLALPGRRIFCLPHKQRVPILRLLLQVEIGQLAQLLFQETLKVLEEPTPPSGYSSERGCLAEVGRALVELVLAQPKGTFPELPIDLYISYIFHREPQPLPLSAEKWSDILLLLVVRDLTEIETAQSREYGAIFNKWLRLSDCNREALLRVCPPEQIPWIEAWCK